MQTIIRIATVSFSIFCLAVIPRTSFGIEIIQIPLSEFTGNIAFESFEGVTVGPNVADEGFGTLRPGIIEEFTFPQSGVRLTHPIPNHDLGAASSVKVTIRTGSFGMGIYDDNQPISAPFGDHFIIHSGGLDDPFELTFPEATSMVGGHWIIGGWSPQTDDIHIEVFGTNNESFGTILAPATYMEDWGTSFFGFRIDDGSMISKITIDNGPGGSPSHPGLDGLMFSVVPEPSSFLSFCVGILCFYPRRR